MAIDYTKGLDLSKHGPKIFYRGRKKSGLEFKARGFCSKAVHVGKYALLLVAGVLAFYAAINRGDLTKGPTQNPERENYSQTENYSPRSGQF